MEFQDIKQLALLMKEAGLTSLEYTDGSANIRMQRGATQLQSVSIVETTPDVVAVPAIDSTVVDGNVHTVTSPMVGVFYAAPAADKKPYVSVGDKVEAGDVLCIVEAMKMMNEISAEKSGVIAEICVDNKQTVEYGQPLFRISLD